MWRLWNKLFGWDYVRMVSNDKILKVRKAPAIPAFITYKGGCSIGLLSIDGRALVDVIWLTCKPEKYLGENNV